MSDVDDMIEDDYDPNELVINDFLPFGHLFFKHVYL